MTIYTFESYTAGALVERDVVDTVAATFTVFNGAGQQQSSRALTPTEVARYAAQDATATGAANQSTLQNKAQAALTANAVYQAIASPTNAQVAAQVALLTKENNALIRLLLGLLTDVSGT